MARRRSQHTDTPAGDQTTPAHLRRYQPTDWLPQVSHLPVPDYWGDPQRWPTYHHIRGLRLWLDARRTRQATHGQTP